MGAMLLTGVLSFGQKDEIKEAEKSLKKEDYAATLTTLSSVEGSISSADEKLKEKYYYMVGKANVELAVKGENTYENLDKAGKAFEQLLAVNEKTKYAAEISELKGKGANFVFEEARKQYEAKNFKDAYKGYEKVFRLSPADTVMLYNAALIAYQAEDVDKSIAFYEELKNINFDGTEIKYTAINKDSGEKESFSDKSSRDLMVKSGSYTTPEDEKSPSKRSDIIKNLALLYLQQGDNEKALKAFADAKAENPDDVNLLIGEANVYYQMGDKDKFKTMMQEASAKKPEDATLQFNIGVINLEQQYYEDARTAFKKALEIKPDYEDAALNYSITYVNEGNALVEQMNSLGNSRADTQKYNELGEKKNDLFRQGAEVLENFIKANSGKEFKRSLTQLKNIYGALGDTDNFTRIKKMLGE